MQYLKTIEQLYALYIQHYVVCTDTRAILPNSIFFALKGANFNGNTFAVEALAQGAAFAVVDEDIDSNDARLYKTTSVLKTLQQLAHHHRQQLQIPFIGIGGSNGKTTTKELLNAVLSQKYTTYATKGNLNNHIGVPLTLLAIKPHIEMAIIEMGTNQPGDMEELCGIADPNFGITTNIGKEHLEGFGSLEGVAKEESVLYLHLMKNNGLAFVNANNEWLSRMAARLQKVHKYGYNTPTKKIVSADYLGELKTANPFIECRLPNADATVKAQLSGEFNFENIMAAAAIGNYFGVEGEKIKTAIEGYAPTNNRSQVVVKGTNTLYLDCYNANPSSMEVALKNFAAFSVPNKIVVLGDMFELGDFAPAEHQAITLLCKELGFETVYMVGKLFAPYAPLINAVTFDTAADLSVFFEQQTPQNAYILFKASRGIALEKAAEGL